MSTLAFKYGIGDMVSYYVGNDHVVGVVNGLYQYKDEPTQALIEYIGKDGTVNTLWRNEKDLEY